MSGNKTPEIFNVNQYDATEENKDPLPRNSVEEANSKDHPSLEVINEDPKKEEEKGEEYYKKIQEEKEKEEILHLSKDMWFTKLIVTKGWLIILIAVSFILLMTILSVVLGGFELSDEHERDYLVWDDKMVKDWDKLELAKEKVNTNFPGEIQPLRTSVITDWVTSVTFECTDCDTILTADFIKQMYAIEQKVKVHSDYSKYCQAESTNDTSCKDTAYKSFTRNFEGSINTLTQAQVDTFLATMSTDSVYTSNNIFLETTFTQSNLKSKRARAIFLFAGPIEVDGKRYKSYHDDEAEQGEKFVDFTKEVKDTVESSTTDLKVKLFNEEWYDIRITEFIMGDFALAILSFIFVLIYISFHLKSFFLASTAMIAIGFSYPIAIVINRFIFQVDFFQSLNFVAVFVILGISADNVFVFTDAWQQSGQHVLLNEDTENKYNNFQKRMNYTWRKATKAISTTSFTTAMAFLATGFSKIMPISAFGFFASVLVVVNYCFAIIVFPACLIIFERYLAHRCMYRKFIGDLFLKW